MSEPAPSKIGGLVRWILGLLIVWASLGKLANLQGFYVSLLAYRLPFSVFLLRGVAIVLPWIELLTGLALLAIRRHRGALAWALALGAVFGVCTGQAWLRGLDIDCGCLDLRVVGLDPRSPTALWLESVPFAFLRAVALAGAALWLFRLEARSPSRG